MLRIYIRCNQIRRNQKWLQITWAKMLLSLISPFRFWARKQQKRPMWLWFLLALSSKRWPWSINHVHMTFSWNTAHHLVNSLSLLLCFTTLSLTPHLLVQSFRVTCLCSQLGGGNHGCLNCRRMSFCYDSLMFFPVMMGKGSLWIPSSSLHFPVLLFLVPTG